MVRSRKVLVKNNYRSFFLRDIVLSGFVPKYPSALGVKNRNLWKFDKIIIKYKKKLVQHMGF
jgi:hypothetical protein